MLVRVKGNVIFQKTNTVNVTDLKKTGLECGAKRDFVPKLGYPSGRILYDYHSSKVFFPHSYMLLDPMIPLSYYLVSC